MDDSLFQIIFVALLFVGWVIKSIAEAKQRDRRGGGVPRRGPPHGPPTPLFGIGDLFRPPPAPPPRPPEPAPPPPPDLAPPPPVVSLREAMRTRRALAPPKAPQPLRRAAWRAGESSEAPTVSGAYEGLSTDLGHIDRRPIHELGAPLGQLPDTMSANAQQARRVRDAFRRLMGGREGRPDREAARAGFFWSEILGPCRAVRGFHVCPTFDRHRRGAADAVR